MEKRSEVDLVRKNRTRALSARDNIKGLFEVCKQFYRSRVRNSICRIGTFQSSSLPKILSQY